MMILPCGKEGSDCNGCTYTECVGPENFDDTYRDGPKYEAMDRVSNRLGDISEVEEFLQIQDNEGPYHWNGPVPKEDLPLLMDALHKACTERQREVLILCLGLNGHKYSFSQVARLLGIDKTTVREHFRAGIKNLRKELGDKYPWKSQEEK